MAEKLTFEDLRDIAYRVSPEYATRLLAIAGKESTFGENKAAYKPNPQGAIGPMQILSSTLGAKYNNFERFAAPGKSNPLNPAHAAEAGMRMALDHFKRYGVDQGTMNYLGRGKKDALGTTPASYLSDITKLEQQVKSRMGTPATNSGIKTMTNDELLKSTELQQDPAYRSIMENAALLRNTAQQSATAGNYSLGAQSPLGGAIEQNAALLAENMARQNARFQENPDQSFLERAFSRIVGGFGDALFAQGAKEKLATATEAQRKLADLSGVEKQAAAIPSTALGAEAQALSQLLQFTQPTASQRMSLGEQARQFDAKLPLEQRQVALQEAIQPAQLQVAQANANLAQAQFGMVQDTVATKRQAATKFKDAAASLGVTLPDAVDVEAYKGQLPAELFNSVSAVAATGALATDPQTALSQARTLPSAVAPETAAGWSGFISANQIPAKEQAAVLKQYGLDSLSDAKTKQAALGKAASDRVRAAATAARESGTGAGWTVNPYRWDANDFKAHATDPRLVAIPGGAAVAAAAANGGMLSTKDVVSLLISGKPLDQGVDSITKYFKAVVGLNNSSVRKFKLMGAPEQTQYKAGQFDLANPASAQMYLVALKREQEIVAKYKADNPFSSRLDAINSILTDPAVSGDVDKLLAATKFAINGKPDIKSTLGD